jgi:hypothetical protein
MFAQSNLKYSSLIFFNQSLCKDGEDESMELMQLKWHKGMYCWQKFWRVQ